VGSAAEDSVVHMDEFTRVYAAANAGCCCFMARCYVRSIMKSHGVSTSGCITRFSERTVAVWCHLFRTSKNVEAVNF